MYVFYSSVTGLNNSDLDVMVTVTASNIICIQLYNYVYRYVCSQNQVPCESHSSTLYSVAYKYFLPYN